MMIMFFIGLVMVPLIGYYVDKKGKRIILYFFCIFMVLLTNILLFFIPPTIPVILGGFGMSIHFAIANLPYIVDKPELVLIDLIIFIKGTAYGIKTAVQNIIVLLLPIYLT